MQDEDTLPATQICDCKLNWWNIWWIALSTSEKKNDSAECRVRFPLLATDTEQAFSHCQGSLFVTDRERYICNGPTDSQHAFFTIKKYNPLQKNICVFRFYAPGKYKNTFIIKYHRRTLVYSRPRCYNIIQIGTIILNIMENSFKNNL